AEDDSESTDQTQEAAELEASEIPPIHDEHPTTELPTPIETEVVSKSKKIKKRVIKPKDSELGEDVSESIDQTQESIELEAGEIPSTPVEDQPAELPTPIETEVVSKIKKIKKRVIKPKDSELGEDVSESIDQTQESIELEAGEIPPTPDEDQPTELSTPIETEVVSKTK